MKHINKLYWQKAALLKVTASSKCSYHLVLKANNYIHLYLPSTPSLFGPLHLTSFFEHVFFPSLSLLFTYLLFLSLDEKFLSISGLALAHLQLWNFQLSFLHTSPSFPT